MNDIWELQREVFLLREENAALRAENTILHKQVKDFTEIAANYDPTAVVRAALAGIALNEKRD